MGTAPWYTVEITTKRCFTSEEEAREWYESTKTGEWEGKILYHSGGDDKPQVIADENIEF